MKTARRVVPLFRPYRVQVAAVIALILLTSTIGIVTVVAMVIISWQLTIVALITVPAFFWLTKTVGERRRQVSRSTQESLAAMSALSEETLSVSGVLLAKAFGNQARDTTRYHDENQHLAELEVRQQMIGQGFSAIVQVFLPITPAAVYRVAGLLLAHGTAISAGTVVAFTTLQTRLYFPIGQLLQVSVELRSSLALFDRIFEYLDVVPDIVDAPDAVDLRVASGSGRVALREVYFRYPGTEADALAGISLQAEPGQLVALVGPSGAGKTTISYLIPRLYDVTGGRSRSTGPTCAAYGRRRWPPYVHDRIMEFPGGYDTIVGERGYRPSGGEKQRLAIARVLLQDPRILILDEATSALDTASEREVQKALDALMGSWTTIAIAHRLSTVVNADVINVIAGGSVAESGTHAGRHHPAPGGPARLNHRDQVSLLHLPGGKPGRMSIEQRETLDAILRQSAFPADSDVNELRRQLKELTAAQPLPADLTVTPAALGGVPAAEITIAGVEPRHVVLYFHGGVYVLGDAFQAAELASQVGRRTGARVFSLDYRLAPEHPYPAAVDDALAAYQALLQGGTTASDIVFAGESAGGGLAVATMVNARDHGLPLPAAAYAMSPYADLTLAGASMDSKHSVDPLLSRDNLQARIPDYTSGQDTALGLISPIFADLSGLPPLIIQAGSHEVLLDDAIRLAGAAAAADVQVALDITPGVPHVFQAYHALLDEATEALNRAGQLLSAALRAAA